MIYFTETWYQVLGELPDAESGRLVKDILGYIFERKEPAEKSAAFLLMRKEYDRCSSPKLAIVETSEREAMKANEQMVNHLISQHRIPRPQVMRLIDEFCDEQEAAGKVHESLADANKHLMSWVNVKFSKTNGTNQQQQAIANWNDAINQQAASLFAGGGAGGN